MQHLLHALHAALIGRGNCWAVLVINVFHGANERCGSMPLPQSQRAIVARVPVRGSVPISDSEYCISRIFALEVKSRRYDMNHRAWMAPVHDNGSSYSDTTCGIIGTQFPALKILSVRLLRSLCEPVSLCQSASGAERRSTFWVPLGQALPYVCSIRVQMVVCLHKPRLKEA